MNFSTGVFHVEGDGPLTQAQVDSVWRYLPTTGASWIEHGNLFVQQFDGATAFNLGPVERGVKGVSAKVRVRRGGHAKKRQHATKKSAAQLDAEIAEILRRYPFDDANLRQKWMIDPSELRVGQRFDYFGQPYEIVKIGRDKDKTIQIAVRHTSPSGRESFVEHKSFPLRHFYQQHLRPLRR